MSQNTLHVLVCDIDHVLFDPSHRDHLMPTENIGDNTSWAAHQDPKQVMLDADMPEHQRSVYNLICLNDVTVFLTSRSEANHDVTLTALQKFLERHHGRKFNPHRINLTMRPLTNHQPPAVYKAHMMQQIVRSALNTQVKGKSESEVAFTIVDDSPEILRACAKAVNDMRADPCIIDSRWDHRISNDVVLIHAQVDTNEPFVTYNPCLLDAEIETQ